MNKPIENIGVIRESRPDENRTPLVPDHIQIIKSKSILYNCIQTADNMQLKATYGEKKI